ncbi:uncharacterized protein LOC111346712 [Stylophora pistillata]|uniref:uncharacterized protein LOC111346712 n=1 Tax=Stylophora pistillata TaxID=50429 RepID=UPI000C046FC4|nr:uncharacterized protein LOC111346712 [Stylophora pistillata]
MRTKGTVCRSANDMCDQTEKCDGRLGICPAFVVDSVTVTTGTVKIVDQNFHNTIFYQHVTDKLFINISGFNVSCGKMNLRWFLLPGASSCSGSSLANGIIQSTNNLQTLSGLTLQDGKSYKISIAASDLRDKIQHRECSSAVIVDTSKPTHGWVHDGEADDLDYQSSKLFQVNWGGFQTRNGIDNYDWKVLLTSYGKVRQYPPMIVAFVEVEEPRKELNEATNVATSFSKGGLLLRNNTRYFVIVNATDGVGLSTTAASDGVLIDTSHPIIAKIYDGSQTGSDAKYATWINTFSANWEPFLDIHSFILKYTWAVYHLNVGFITQFTFTGFNRSGTAKNLKLVSGEKYCAVGLSTTEALEMCLTKLILP